MAVGLSHIGLMTVETAMISAFGLIAVVVGVKLGGRLRRRLSPDQFRRIVLRLLIALGALLAAKPVLFTD